MLLILNRASNFNDISIIFLPIYSFFFLVSFQVINFHSIEHSAFPETLLLNFKRIRNRCTSSRNTDQYSSSPRSSLFLLYTPIYFSLEYGKYPQTAKLPATINSIKTFVNQSSYTLTRRLELLLESLSPSRITPISPSRPTSSC